MKNKLPGSQRGAGECPCHKTIRKQKGNRTLRGYAEIEFISMKEAMRGEIPVLKRDHRGTINPNLFRPKNGPGTRHTATIADLSLQQKRAVWNRRIKNFIWIWYDFSRLLLWYSIFLWHKVFDLLYALRKRSNRAKKLGFGSRCPGQSAGILRKQRRCKYTDCFYIELNNVKYL